MRCPKCSYLSYEDVTRCRNCGYDFALAVPPDQADPPTLDAPAGSRTWDESSSRPPDDPADQMGVDEETAAVDLPLFEPPAPLDPPEPPDPSHPLAAPTSPAPFRSPEPPRASGPARRWEPSRTPEPPAPRRPSRTPEHPGSPGALDAPPVPIPPAPPPLVVRRTVDLPKSAASTPAGGARHGAGRSRPVPAPALDFDMAADDEPTSDAETPLAGHAGDESFHGQPLHDDAAAVPAAGSPDAPTLGARIGAGLVDGGLLIGIDLLVLGLTLRLLGLSWPDWSQLPLAPLIGFLCLLDLSYLVTFTAASGQTIGKMLAGVRITTEGGGSVPFGHAVVRSVTVLLCAIPLGLGLLAVLLDAEGRGLHDRLAGTRVGLAE